jgi:signal-transduction protein with cAMP-binding, CBS, and nucleotidyltransferase domain
MTTNDANGEARATTGEARAASGEAPETTGEQLDPVRAALGLHLHQVMTQPVVFGDPELSVTSAAATMTSGGIGSVVLLRPDGPTAIVTERDVVQAVADGIDPHEAWAADVATDDLITLTTNDTLADAIIAMADGVHHVPVRRGKEVVGLVSVTDVVATLAAALRDGGTDMPR